MKSMVNSIQTDKAPVLHNKALAILSHSAPEVTFPRVAHVATSRPDKQVKLTLPRKG